MFAEGFCGPLLYTTRKGEVIMAVEVWESEEVKEMAVKLITSFEDHSHLVDLLDGRMKFYFVEKGSFEGKARMMKGTTADAASGTVFLIEINFSVWGDLNEKQKWALVDTQLSRCGGESNDADGTFKYSIEKPNVDVFTSVVSRWGAYNDTLVDFVTAVTTCDEHETRKRLKESKAPVAPSAGNYVSSIIEEESEEE